MISIQNIPRVKEDSRQSKATYKLSERSVSPETSREAQVYTAIAKSVVWELKVDALIQSGTFPECFLHHKIIEGKRLAATRRSNDDTSRATAARESGRKLAAKDVRHMSSVIRPTAATEAMP